MKKAIVILFVLALCTTLLCGCRLSFLSSAGLSSFQYDNAAQYTVGGDFSSELPCISRDNSHICGDGTGEYEIDTTSGDLCIKKNGSSL